ncbi:hypothetical protein G7L61_23230, partial [Shigella sonnei]|uniref:hypothetical protein n=1 Tax=Shigella sonnei TaxID=624 RepID=UPI0014941787
GIAHLSPDAGPPFRMPRFAATEVLARELGLVFNRPAAADARERARGEALRLSDLAYMADRARAIGPAQLAALAPFRD